MVKSNIEFNKLRKTVGNLPARQKIILLEDLYKTTWQMELKQLLKRLDKKSKSRTRLTDTQIKAEVDAVRQDVYDKRRR